ncbi:hypothetical protein [Luteolibacter luteus]|uniref:Uncharacterized protein n=1 Tax=Luteolibacter luteus TaxID=2728835 RepID=A0A858RLQ8_9BACT|nr:hypothetical protein [Luteolibacter luteus]QJE97319.1 hypothetical protein HHL09_16495 [Luteolibacter luteus]
MKIKETIYTTLNARDRVAATVSALARKDTEEVLRLKKSCPKKRYVANEDAYVGTMQALEKIGSFVEVDLRGLAIDYLGYSSPGTKWETDAHKTLVRSFASIREAWRRLAGELGIDFDDLQAIRGPRHDFVEQLAQSAEGRHDESQVQEYLTAMQARFA